MPKPLTLEQRKILELYKDTEISAKEIGIKANIYFKTVFSEYRKAGGRPLYNAEEAQKRIEKSLERRHLSNSLRKKIPEILTLQERKQIEKLKDTNLSGQEIGDKIGRHKNVVNREFRLAGGRNLYDAKKAQQQFQEIKENKFSKLRQTVPNQPTKIVDRPFIDEDLSSSFIEQLKSNIKTTPENTSALSHNLDIPRLPLKIWVDRWKEEKSKNRSYWSKEKKYFEFWIKNFGDTIAIDLKPNEIEACADEVLNTVSRTGRTLGSETRRKYLAYLSSLYSTAIYEWKWAIFNPLSCIRMKPKKIKYQTLNQTYFPEYEEFKSKYIELIKSKSEGLTQREMAKKSGITLHTLQYSLESGNNITVKILLKVCLAFGIKLRLE